MNLQPWDQIDENDPKPSKRAAEAPNAIARFPAWMLLFCYERE